jgi:hypothetical protein
VYKPGVLIPKFCGNFHTLLILDICNHNFCSICNKQTGWGLSQSRSCPCYECYFALQPANRSISDAWFRTQVQSIMNGTWLVSMIFCNWQLRNLLT